jgi:adenylosuccinate synthase
MLIEGSQGFDLDINHGIEYPYCTSRGTTPQQVLADCGIHPNHVQHTIAVLRTYPIRVGNVVENGVQVGFSGNFGGRELDWSEVTKRSGSPVPLEERTTVTQRVRRVFEMDFERLKYMHSVCKPTEYALTFADYIDYRLTDKTSMFADGVPDEARAKTWEFIAKLEETVGHDMVSMLKTGAKDSALIDMQSDAIDLFGFSD